MSSKKLSVAIIGAGLSGLTCAKYLLLRSPAIDVTIFEKSRGAGGRMATRRITDANNNGSTSKSPSNSAPSSNLTLFSFDHGAQYFTVRDKEFRKFIDELTGKGIVQEWKGIIKVIENGKVSETKGEEHRYVGVEGMSSICRSMAKSLNIHFETRITDIQQKNENKQYTLISENGKSFGEYDWVVSTCPAPQTIELLKKYSPKLVEKASKAEMYPCWTLMVGFDKTLDEIKYDAAFVNNNPISWICRNSSKPGAPKSESWVIQASSEWSQEHLEDAPEKVQEVLLSTFQDVVGTKLTKPAFITVHRWRYAKVKAIEETFLTDDSLKLAICGDYCGGPRVEGSFRSGYLLAEYISQFQAKL